MEVSGRDMISGLPRKTIVTAEEIREALQEPVTQHHRGRHAARSSRPSRSWPPTWSTTASRWPAAVSLLRGLTTVISNATGLDVRLAEDPLTCVARGTSVYLENLELWKDTMESDADDM